MSPSYSSCEYGSKNGQTNFTDEEYSETPKNCMLLKYGNKYLLWGAEKIEFSYVVSSNISICVFIGQIIDKLRPYDVLVTPAMMGYEFPLPLDEDIARL